MKHMLFVIVLLILTVYILCSVGCNTINGLGKDLQSWTADETYGYESATVQRQQALQQQSNASRPSSY